MKPKKGKHGEVVFEGKKPKTGEHGELIFEDDRTRVVLFMGEDGEDNQRFIRSQLAQGKGNMIITDRSHSYHLKNNFPSDIFGNRPNQQILFIPGSCGSSGSTPEYIAANPQTDLRFISNTSTGRGEVTNAIIDALIETREPTLFSAILRRERLVKTIEDAGGSVGTIKVFSPGEALLHYVGPKPEPVFAKR